MADCWQLSCLFSEPRRPGGVGWAEVALQVVTELVVAPEDSNESAFPSKSKLRMRGRCRAYTFQAL